MSGANIEHASCDHRPPTIDGETAIPTAAIGALCIILRVFVPKERLNASDGSKCGMLSQALFLALVFVSGCAQIPDASLKYYLAKSSLRLDITRSVSCDAGGRIVVSNAVSPVITNSADLRAEHIIDLKRFKGVFTDPAVGVEFFSDGRLKGINVKQTGTAKQVIESALQVVSAILPTKKAAVQGPCEFIKEHGSKGILTILYSDSISTSTKAQQGIPPVGASEFYHERLRGEIGDLHTHIGSANLTRLDHPIRFDTEKYDLFLTARQLTKVSFGVHTNLDSTDFWTGSVLMALPGNEYRIPVPRAPTFGQQDFAVTFSEAGSLRDLSYASTSGAADAISVTGTVIGETQGPSASEQAAALKAEADLIAQRQRLAACQADPSECK